MTKLELEASTNTPDTVLIWDRGDSPPAGDWTTVLWSGFNETASPDVISIPNLVEDNAEYLRRRYLSWVYELGETIIQGRRLVDHLELRPGFSYWWMTLFAQKCNFLKSSQIADAIKLLAFEDWVANQSIRHIVMETSSAALAGCIRSWCVNSKIAFKWQRFTAKAEEMPPLKRLYLAFPHALQALGWLAFYLIQRWSLKGVGLRGWQQTDGRVTFVSYLFNLVADSANTGRFRSTYWANLPDELQHNGCKTNWLHLYVKDASLPNAKKAAMAIRLFNKVGKKSQVHVTLDAFLGWRVVFSTMRDWLYIRRVGIKLQPALVVPQEMLFNLWPLFEDDWQHSFAGQAALSNLLNLNLYETAMLSLPKQRVGVYLQENQPWEFALIHSWGAASHGRLIGAPHTTVRFWDLRYFFDQRSYDRLNKNQLPMPYQVAVNGLAAHKAYVESGYPRRELIEVEALRYLYLTEANVKACRVSRQSGMSMRILVIGDYNPKSTKLQIRLLEKAASLLPSDAIYTVKPHPACPIDPADYPRIRMNVSLDPISNLLTECDVAYSSNGTSAALDACCMGVPLVTILDPNSLNLSPLRKSEGAIFIRTIEELTEALVSCASIQRPIRVQLSMFTLDPMLPRWRKLLTA